MTSLTVGIDDDSSASLAEAFVLRGARSSNGCLESSASTSGMLDAILGLERRRCVQHTCVATMPMAVPLPFPRIFSPQLTCNGDLPIPLPLSETLPDAAGADQAAASCRSSPGSAHVAGEVETVPVLAKLRSTRQFEGLVNSRLRDFGRAYGLSAGQSVMDSWGYDAGEVSELKESLREVAAAYHDEDTEVYF